MRVLLGTLMILGATPAFPQHTQQKQKISDDEPIVVSGLADGARVVEVDFDKVWKNCAECKRALAKLDRLSAAYRAEVEAAEYAVDRPSGLSRSLPSAGVSTFARSSATGVDTWDERRRIGVGDGQRTVIGERQNEQSQVYFNELNARFIRPEAIKLQYHMRSFLDQLAPHLATATEAERIAHRASAGLTDKKRTKLAAKKLTRIDVTAAVIRRLDASDFTIKLPEPIKSPARR